MHPQSTHVSEPEQEEWRPVVGYQGLYEVSNLGRIRRVAPGPMTFPGKVLKVQHSKAPYPWVMLYGQAKPRVRAVHRLVAEAFLGPCPSGFEVNHKDCDRRNAAHSNLEYLTPVQNSRHALEHGRIRMMGESHYRAKLTEDAVRAIRASSEPVAVLALRFGVSPRTVWDVQHRRKWRHIQ